MEKELEPENRGKGVGDCSHAETEAEDDVRNELINSESRTPLKTPIKETEVKFIVSDSLNGDAKIDIANVKSGFGGMSKEELLKYVNDPFWVRTRTALFILFWLIWVVMFITAIAIIVMAPRCEAPKPRKWYEKGPLVDIELPKDGNSFDSVSKQLHYLSELQVKGIILPPIFSTDEFGNVIDFKTIRKEYGTLEQFKNLISAAKKRAIHILMSLVPNYTSLKHDWFNKSVERITPFDSYYVWAGSSETSPVGPHSPPNNWLSVEDESAWTFHPTRKEFYLHQFKQNQPDLNFHNSRVVEEINSVLTYWLSFGVSGFNLDKVQYLLEDPEKKNEEGGGSPGYSHDQYHFWGHDKTYNYAGVAELVSSWRDLTRKTTNGDGIIAIFGPAPTAANMNQTAGPDLVRDTSLMKTAKGKLSAADLEKNILSAIKNKQWPALDIASPRRRVADLDPSAVDPINIAAMLLSGTPIIRFGDDLGLKVSQSADAHEATPTDSTLNVNLYKKLSELRESHAVLHGDFNVTVLNETLVLTRWQAGYPGYVALWNPSLSNVTLNLSEFTQFPPELSLLASGGTNAAAVNPRVATEKVTLPVEAVALFTFVPAE